ncbi:MAG: hypothetical protein IKE38_04390, partial [Erysipelotrichaceae bacterium]|nr:hypothetical protein [Erysipelotrichaceae bacterium]
MMSNTEKQYLSLEKEEPADTGEELMEIGEEPEEKPVNGLLFKNDKYYWVAELPMLKCFFLLFEVWRVLGISAIIVGMFSLIVSLIGGDGIDAFIATFGMIGLVLA